MLNWSDLDPIIILCSSISDVIVYINVIKAISSLLVSISHSCQPSPTQYPFICCHISMPTQPTSDHATKQDIEKVIGEITIIKSDIDQIKKQAEIITKSNETITIEDVIDDIEDNVNSSLASIDELVPKLPQHLNL